MNIPQMFYLINILFVQKPDLVTFGTGIVAVAILAVLLDRLSLPRS